MECKTKKDIRLFILLQLLTAIGESRQPFFSLKGIFILRHIGKEVFITQPVIIDWYTSPTAFFLGFSDTKSKKNLLKSFLVFRG